MSDTTVWTFFYGSNMNLDILKAVDYIPEQVEVARLHGFDIQIRPLANLIRSDRYCVYGILATGTHDELDRLYGRYVHGELGAIYLPHAVLCEKLDGLCCLLFVTFARKWSRQGLQTSTWTE